MLVADHEAEALLSPVEGGLVFVFAEKRGLRCDFWVVFDTFSDDTLFGSLVDLSLEAEPLLVVRVSAALEGFVLHELATAWSGAEREDELGASAAALDDLGGAAAVDCVAAFKGEADVAPEFAVTVRAL